MLKSLFIFIYEKFISILDKIENKRKEKRKLIKFLYIWPMSKYMHKELYSDSKTWGKHIQIKEMSLILK